MRTSKRGPFEFVGAKIDIDKFPTLFGTHEATSPAIIAITEHSYYCTGSYR